MKKKIFIVCFIFIIINNIHCQNFLREIDLKNPRMNGQDITNLQNRLMELGFKSVGEIDGYYGPKTATEIRFIKSVLGLVSNFSFRDNSTLDFLVNKHLWEIIFDNNYSKLLNGISIIKSFYDDPLGTEYDKNIKITGYKNSKYKYFSPPESSRDIVEVEQIEFLYNSEIHVKTIRRSGHENFQYFRTFSLKNGIEILEYRFGAESLGDTNYFILAE